MRQNQSGKQSREMAFQFTGFTDEAERSLEGQIATLREVGWSAIELRLIDGVGELIGVRRFEPAEYLDDSIAISAGMAPGQPIYVVMEIGGDAAQATSFEFSFL